MCVCVRAVCSLFTLCEWKLVHFHLDVYSLCIFGSFIRSVVCSFIASHCWRVVVRIENFFQKRVFGIVISVFNGFVVIGSHISIGSYRFGQSNLKQSISLPTHSKFERTFETMLINFRHFSLAPKMFGGQTKFQT